MSTKRHVVELLVQAFAKAWAHWPGQTPSAPSSIFVLRNNDIGDLLVSTPLFEALRTIFPATHLSVGVAHWNRDVLVGNPFVSEVCALDAPWFNQGRPSHGFLKALRYIFTSPQAQDLAARQPSIGIDVVGSQMGALLMARARIPYRVGSKGYAGGHTAVQAYIASGREEHVGRAILRYAELLGATKLPSTRPQIFLTPEEVEVGHMRWSEAGMRKRVVVAPGSSTPGKSWPRGQFVELCDRLPTSYLVHVIGSKPEQPLGEALSSGRPHVRSLVGQLSLREAFATIAVADFVICNSSMAMHAAGAFSTRTIVVLGPEFEDPKHHQRMWAHDDQVVLGRDDNTSLVAPDDVVRILAQWH